MLPSPSCDEEIVFVGCYILFSLLYMLMCYDDEYR